jgi:hypothetical protein
MTPADILREYTRTVEIATRSEVVEVERLDTDAMAAEIVRLRRYEEWFDRFAEGASLDSRMADMIAFYGDPSAPLPTRVIDLRRKP